MTTNSPRLGPDAADEVGEDISFLAHVERVMAPVPPAAPARPRPAARPPVSPAPTPLPDDEETHAHPRHLLRCGGCGWEVECLAADADRFLRAGCLLCGGGVRPAVTESAPPPARKPAAGPKDQRRGARRRAQGQTRVEVRRAGPGPARDLALALADVSAEGIGVWLTAQLRPGEQVEVVVSKPTGPAVRGPAEVRWCAAGGDWTYRAGLRLRYPLNARDLSDLTV